jgi:prepilin-type processing-associated H-X9-DG protein/prepilin-type N-terminal cleavage/methylation domain-containing protein
MKKAFTLIEILVVIAVIALLAGILFPVFAQVREKSRTITCLAHMKQMGTAIQMYVQDYDETYPVIHTYPDGNHGGPKYAKDIVFYTELIHPYTKSSQLKCPHIPVYQNIDKKFTTGYIMNNQVGKVLLDGIDRGRVEIIGSSLNAVYLPSMSVLLTECKTGRMVIDHPDSPFPNFPNLFGVEEILNIAKGEPDGGIRHSGGSNYVFCDGHVKWYKPDIFFDFKASVSGNAPTFRVRQNDFVN